MEFKKKKISKPMRHLETLAAAIDSNRSGECAGDKPKSFPQNFSRSDFYDLVERVVLRSSKCSQNDRGRTRLSPKLSENDLDFGRIIRTRKPYRGGTIITLSDPRWCSPKPFGNYEGNYRRRLRIPNVEIFLTRYMFDLLRFVFVLKPNLKNKNRLQW